jgi:hypothetical protein
MKHPPRRRRVWAGSQPVETPPAAVAFYRHPRWKSLALALAVAAAIAGTPFQRALIAEIFADHKRRYRHRFEVRDAWGNAREISRWLAGKWIRLFFGDCDDFAILVLMAQVKAGIPRGACRLCMVVVGGPPRHTGPAGRRGGPGEGHLVLVVQTEQGSLVCDSLQARPLWGDDPAFDGYELVAIEAPPVKPGGVALWVSLQVNTLADLLPK